MNGLPPIRGADGCPAGWLAVAMPPHRPDLATAVLHPSASALLPGARALAIDIPIGLMDTPEDGPRPADRAARRYLRDRNTEGVRAPGARVFATPTRAHLDAFRQNRDYAAFRRAFPPPRSLSKQCWNICDKIAELDDLCRGEAHAPIWEAHPEVAFAFHAGRTLPPKKSPGGALARETLLNRLGFDLPALAAALPPTGKDWVRDDLFDACILTVTADRIAESNHAALPDATGRDRFGLRRAIHY